MRGDWKADSVQTRWSNRYGTLVVEPVTEVGPVAGIRGANIDDEVKFDLDTAGKIVLVTDNRRCQVSGEFRGGGRLYLIVHTSCSTAAVVRVVSLDFAEGVVPGDEIARLAAPVALEC